MANNLPVGTTPTHKFNVNLDLRSAVVVYLTYAQGRNVVLEKTKDDLLIEENSVSVYLTQKDTLKFKQNKDVEIQFRVRFPDNSAPKSIIMTTTADRILKSGEI